jgi:F-type H+-transporting ATPase subunit O
MLSRSAFRAVRAAAPQRTVARAAVRSYAAAATQDSKPPIAVYGLDGTYATALVRRPLQPASTTIRSWLSA